MTHANDTGRFVHAERRALQTVNNALRPSLQPMAVLPTAGLTDQYRGCSWLRRCSTWMSGGSRRRGRLTGSSCPFCLLGQVETVYLSSAWRDSLRHSWSFTESPATHNCFKWHFPALFSIRPGPSRILLSDEVAPPSRPTSSQLAGDEPEIRLAAGAGVCLVEQAGPDPWDS